MTPPRPVKALAFYDAEGLLVGFDWIANPKYYLPEHLKHTDNGNGYAVEIIPVEVVEALRTVMKMARLTNKFRLNDTLSGSLELALKAYDNLTQSKEASHE